MNPHATFGCCLFAASLGMFTFPVVAVSMSFYIPSLFASSYPSPALSHTSSALLFTFLSSRLSFWDPYPRTLLRRLPLLYCHVSLHSPAFYISLMLSTCRSQPSTMPLIRPWASDSSSKVLFSACVLHPQLYLVEPTPISCPTPPLLNDDSEATQGRKTAQQVVPSCCLRHHNQSKGRICKFDKSRCVVSLKSS